MISKLERVKKVFPNGLSDIVYSYARDWRDEIQIHVFPHISPEDQETLANYKVNLLIHKNVYHMYMKPPEKGEPYPQLYENNSSISVGKMVWFSVGSLGCSWGAGKRQIDGLFRLSDLWTTDDYKELRQVWNSNVALMMARDGPLLSDEKISLNTEQVLFSCLMLLICQQKIKL